MNEEANPFDDPKVQASLAPSAPSAEATPLIYAQRIEQNQTPIFSSSSSSSSSPFESLSWLSSKYVLYILLFLAMFTSSLVFAFTCMQFEDHQKSNGFSINSCAKVPHLPLRLKIKESGEVLSCAWAVKDSVGRFFLSSFTLFWPALLCYFLYAHKKMFSYIWILVTAVCAFGYFAMMIADSDSIRKSSDWCKSGWAHSSTPPQVLPPSANISCNYQPFIATAGFDALAFVFWLLLTCWGAKIIWSRSEELFDHHEHHS